MLYGEREWENRQGVKEKRHSDKEFVREKHASFGLGSQEAESE